MDKVGENLWISAGKIDQVIPSLSPELSTEHMFVERMFDFPAQKFRGKNRTYVRPRRKKSSVVARVARAPRSGSVGGRAGGERARIFGAGGGGGEGRRREFSGRIFRGDFGNFLGGPATAGKFGELKFQIR